MHLFYPIETKLIIKYFFFKSINYLKQSQNRRYSLYNKNYKKIRFIFSELLKFNYYLKLNLNPYLLLYEKLI